MWGEDVGGRCGSVRDGEMWECERWGDVSVRGGKMWECERWEDVGV